MNEIFVQSVKKDTPPNSLNSGVQVAAKKPRSSNLELYRIICMLMIVAHHYVVNSGLFSGGGPLVADYTSGNSIFLILFGAWGKTGINCFVLITGYFMCKSQITLRKFLKLMFQIWFYRILLYPVFMVAGYETFSVTRIFKIVMPFWGLSDNFTGCFLFFYLTIPFWNVLVQHLTKKQHELLLLLLLLGYSILGSMPSYKLSFNYVSWFGILFLIASYIRIYPNRIFENRKLWGWLTLGSLICALASMLVLSRLWHSGWMGYFLVIDSNKILALLVSVCSFLWFKNLDIKYSKIINTIGATTFGVFLIHANSDAMRRWLWQDTFDSLGHYASMTTGNLIIYSVCIVFVVFVVCSLIDFIRIKTVEKWFFGWYDRKFAACADFITNKIIS